MADLSAYDATIEAAAREWGHDPNMLRALLMQENPQADPGAVSPKGAYGLGQIMPDTAKGLGMTDPKDPTQQIFGAAKYLAEGRDKEGSHEGALLYYHGGPDWRSKYGPESQGYVPGVAGHYTALTKKGASVDGPAVPSDDDFLKQAAPAQPASAGAVPSDDEFLKQTGAAAARGPDAGTMPFRPETADTRRIGDLMTPGAPDKTTPTPPAGVNIPAISGPPPGFDFGETSRAAGEGYAHGAVVTPEGIAAADKFGYGLGSMARGINYLSQPAAGIANAGQDVVYQMANSIAPGLGRDVTAAAIALPMMKPGLAPSAAATLDMSANALIERGNIARQAGEAASLNRAAPLSPEFRAAPTAPSYSGEPNLLVPPRTIQAGDATFALPPAEGTPARPAPAMVNRNLPPNLLVDSARPGAVGADVTQGAIPDKTRAEALTDEQKTVLRSAEDRAGPQLRDDDVYVPGVKRMLATRDFSDPSIALDDKVFRGSDPEYRRRAEAIERENNDIMKDHFANEAGDPNAIAKAYDYRDEVRPDKTGVFANEKPVDASDMLAEVDKVLNSADGRRKGVASILQQARDSLLREGDDITAMPGSELYGYRKAITDLLAKGAKGTTEEAANIRTAKSMLEDLLPTTDKTITASAPKFADYLKQWHERSLPIDKMEFLQSYLSGGKRLTNDQGYLQPHKVQTLLEDLYKGRGAKGINKAKAFTPDDISAIEAVRNELSYNALRDRNASVRGSDTHQRLNRAAAWAEGPVGSAFKTVAEAGAHLAAGHLTGGIGNVMLLGAKGFQAGRKAAAAARDAAALAARKEQLLQTTPPAPNILQGP